MAFATLYLLRVSLILVLTNDFHEGSQLLPAYIERLIKSFCAYSRKVSLFHLDDTEYIILSTKESETPWSWVIIREKTNHLWIRFAIMNLRRGKQLFHLFGFVGGVLTFAMPDGILCRDVLVFPILKSILQHTGLLLIPAIEYVSGSYRPSLKDYGWIVAGCLIHLVNCEGINRLLGFTEDYMYLRSDLPFVIPGVPQWITLSLFSLLVFALLCFISDIPGSLKWIRGMKEKLHTS